MTVKPPNSPNHPLKDELFTLTTPTKESVPITVTDIKIITVRPSPAIEDISAAIAASEKFKCAKRLFD